MGSEETQFKPREQHWNWKGGLVDDREAYMKEYLKQYYQEHKQERKQQQQTQEYKAKKRTWDKEYNIRNKEKLSENKKVYYLKNKEKIAKRNQTPARKYWEYKNGAARRNIAFDISFEHYMMFWTAECHYCGGENTTHGMDRVDNSKGYMPDNVVACCGVCNWMKRHLSADEFIAHCKKIAMKTGV